MLTTAGEAALAASRRLLAAGALLGAPAVSDDSTTGTKAGSTEGRLSHSGLSVDTTNKAASSTVTDWAKSSQMRFMRKGFQLCVGATVAAQPPRGCIVPHMVATFGR